MDEPSTNRQLRPGLVLLGLCLAAYVINLDITIVNVALPTLVRETRATTTDLQWVVDAYSLVFAALVLVMGSLSDRFGRKGTLLAGLGVFAVASLAGSLCSSVNELIAARAVMGVGAAMIFPSTLSLISNIFVERGPRARAIGLWGATAGVGIATGPIIGGWLLEHFWWGSIFVFLVPVAIVVGTLVAFAVPPSRDPRRRPIDWRGFVLSSAGMGLLVFGVIEAPDWGWGSTSTLIAIAGGVMILAAFIVVERQTVDPMLDVELFKNPRFTAASGSVTIAFFALSGFIFLTTQYFQFVKSFTPFGAGIRLLPVAASVAIGSVAGTKLAVKIGNKVVVASGLLLFCGGLLWVSDASANTSYGVIAMQMVLIGGGMGLTSAPATEAVMGAVPKEKAGVGSAVNDATRLFGATLGVAIIGSVAASLYVSRLGSTIPPDLPARAVTAAKGSVGGAIVASHVLDRLGYVRPALELRHTAIGAFMHSLAGGCRVAGGVAFVGAVLAATLLPARPRKPIELEAGTLSSPERSPIEVEAPA
jgi:EmrB/QacA subfamily drug resistance transporter